MLSFMLLAQAYIYAVVLYVLGSSDPSLMNIVLVTTYGTWSIIFITSARFAIIRPRWKTKLQENPWQNSSLFILWAALTESGLIYLLIASLLFFFSEIPVTISIFLPVFLWSAIATVLKSQALIEFLITSDNAIVFSQEKQNPLAMQLLKTIMPYEVLAIAGLITTLLMLFT